MAAPQPMVQPDFYGVVNGEEIQVILPQASEENICTRPVRSSEFLALDMKEAPTGEPPHRPNPNVPQDPEILIRGKNEEPGMIWVIGPIIAALVLSSCLVIVYFVRRRRQPYKTPDQAAVTRPLMAADLGAGPAPTDPVDMRRLNFQTPGMISHPPIPISELANHVERLKAKRQS
ncbi:hypothetical protein quinque_009632 [Culex quinquefasciatus]